MEFIPDWEKYTIKAIASKNNKIIVIDAFTKTYSLAGFRLGFCISGNSKLLSDMKLYVRTLRFPHRHSLPEYVHFWTAHICRILTA